MRLAWDIVSKEVLSEGYTHRSDFQHEDFLIYYSTNPRDALVYILVLNSHGGERGIATTLFELPSRLYLAFLSAGIASMASFQVVVFGCCLVAVALLFVAQRRFQRKASGESSGNDFVDITKRIHFDRDWWTNPKRLDLECRAIFSDVGLSLRMLRRKVLF